jgi:ketosteroid isomerase-like protein
MYHAIVKRIAKKNFEAVNTKNYDALLKGCTPNIFHRFGGMHALGGERHDRDALRLWFERLGRMNPGLTLKTQDIWVKGLPHNTTVVMRWTATDTRIDGSPYLNHGVHIIHMRWGKVDAIDANEDSQAVVENLALLAAHGVAEATAPPIVSYRT